MNNRKALLYLNDVMVHPGPTQCTCKIFERAGWAGESNV